MHLKILFYEKQRLSCSLLSFLLCRRHKLKTQGTLYGQNDAWSCTWTHHRAQHPSPTHIAKDGQHSNTGNALTGHILNAVFLFCLMTSTLSANQHQIHIHRAGNQSAHKLLSAYSAAEKCYRFLRDDVLTFSSFFAAYLCNHLFLLL